MRTYACDRNEVASMKKHIQFDVLTSRWHGLTAALNFSLWNCSRIQVIKFPYFRNFRIFALVIWKLISNFIPLFWMPNFFSYQKRRFIVQKSNKFNRNIHVNGFMERTHRNSMLVYVVYVKAAHIHRRAREHSVYSLCTYTKQHIYMHITVASYQRNWKEKERKHTRTHTILENDEKRQRHITIVRMLTVYTKHSELHMHLVRYEQHNIVNVLKFERAILVVLYCTLNK